MTFFIIAAIAALIFFAFRVMANNHGGEDALSDAVVAITLLTVAAVLGAGYGLFLAIHYLVGLMR